MDENPHANVYKEVLSGLIVEAREKVGHPEVQNEGNSIHSFASQAPSTRMTEEQKYTAIMDNMKRLEEVKKWPDSDQKREFVFMLETQIDVLLGKKRDEANKNETNDGAN